MVPNYSDDEIGGQPLHQDVGIVNGNRGDQGRDANRVELWRVVPRSVPFAIGITPSDICNFKCNYCNQSTKAGIKDAQILEWDDFITITHQIEDLLSSSVDDLKIIRLIGNGEPLINKKLPDMIAYLSDKQYAPRIEVTTNGSLLTPEYSDALISAGLTRLLVSVQGTTVEKYRKVCGFSIDIDKFIDQISYFYHHKKQCALYVKTVDIALDNDDDKKKFFDTYTKISDTTCVEHIIDVCSDVDYSTISSNDVKHVSRYGGAFRKKICCDTLFMYLNIHSNGDADCCGCKYPPLYIGNIYQTPIRDLWNGKVHRSIMLKHAQGKRNDIACCRDCCIDGYSSFPEDNLDDHLREVYEKVVRL